MRGGAAASLAGRCLPGCRGPTTWAVGRSTRLGQLAEAHALACTQTPGERGKNGKQVGDERVAPPFVMLFWPLPEDGMVGVVQDS